MLATWGEALREIFAVDPEYKWRLDEIHEMLGTDPKNPEIAADVATVIEYLLKQGELVHVGKKYGKAPEPAKASPSPEPSAAATLPIVAAATPESGPQAPRNPEPPKAVPAPRPAPDKLLVTYRVDGQFRHEELSRSAAPERLAELATTADKGTVRVWREVKIRLMVEVEE